MSVSLKHIACTVLTATLLLSSTTLVAAQAAPSLLDTGGKLAYVASGGGLVVVDARTGSRQQLAGPPLFSVAGPVWSPDGKTVAFIANEIVNGLGGKHGLYVVEADGGGQRAVIPMADAHIQNVHWFPDSQRLVYVAAFQGGGWQVHTVHIDGTGDVTFPWPSDPASADTETDPSISTDGSRVAFAYVSCTAQCYAGLAAETADGRSAVAITESTDRRFRPAPTWTPDGRIAYARGTELHAAATDGSQDDVVLDAGRALGAPIAFGPDGSIAVLCVDGPPALVAELPWHLQLIGPDGSLDGQSTDDVLYPSSKLEWIGQGAGLLFTSSTGLGYIRADGSGATHILNGVTDFDWQQPTTKTQGIPSSANRPKFFLFVAGITTGEGTDGCGVDRIPP